MKLKTLSISVQLSSKRNMSTKDSGKTINGMVEESSNGEMDPSIKVTGKVMSHTDMDG